VNHLEVIELARETSLTSYDASYLWLALHLKGELITLGKKLLNTAVKQRLRTYPQITFPTLVKGGEGGFIASTFGKPLESPFFKGGHYNQSLFTDKL